MDPLMGHLLGSLLINKKGVDGLPKPTSNANFVITLKNKEYIYHLWQNIYFTICTKTVSTPWPNLKTGLPITQYNFKSRALPSLTLPLLGTIASLALALLKLYFCWTFFYSYLNKNKTNKNQRNKVEVKWKQEQK